MTTTVLELDAFYLIGSLTSTLALLMEFYLLFLSTSEPPIPPPTDAPMVMITRPRMSQNVRGCNPQILFLGVISGDLGNKTGESGCG